tara:strand:+ start:380 stop:673 length:294 start_codon:yes stop_codon:yes gene_type:complete
MKNENQLSLFESEELSHDLNEPELVSINSQAIELERTYLRIKKKWNSSQPRDRYPQSFISAESFFKQGEPTAEQALLGLNHLETWLDKMASHDWSAA